MHSMLKRSVLKDTNEKKSYILNNFLCEIWIKYKNFSSGQGNAFDVYKMSALLFKVSSFLWWISWIFYRQFVFICNGLGVFRVDTHSLTPGISFTNGWWAHKPNLVKQKKKEKNTYYWIKIMTRSGHNFAHAMTARLSWHVQNYDLIASLESKLEQKYFSQDFSDELLHC